MIQIMKTKSEFYLGVGQGSVLGVVLFSKFLGDLFFIVNDVDVTSYSNDKTSFFVDTKTHEAISRLQVAYKTLVQWFNQNKKVANQGKCHFICSSNVNIMRKNKRIATVLVKSFQVCFFYSKLTFQSVIYSICNIHQH